MLDISIPWGTLRVVESVTLHRAGKIWQIPVVIGAQGKPTLFDELQLHDELELPTYRELDLRVFDYSYKQCFRGTRGILKFSIQADPRCPNCARNRRLRVEVRSFNWLCECGRNCPVEGYMRRYHEMAD